MKVIVAVILSMFLVLLLAQSQIVKIKRAFGGRSLQADPLEFLGDDQNEILEKIQKDSLEYLPKKDFDKVSVNYYPSVKIRT
jgi:hypothetical protein